MGGNEVESKVESMIELIYDSLLESEMIQEGRKNSQRETERISGLILENRHMTKEELADQLYGLVFILEKAGFRAGCICGANIERELHLINDKNPNPN